MGKFTQSVLNVSEGGGGGGVTFVDYIVEEDGDVLNMHADELFSACKNGIVIFIERPVGDFPVEYLHMLGSASYDEYEGMYVFNVFNDREALDFIAHNNDYPKHTYN